MTTVKYLDKMIAFTYRAKRYAGTDKDSVVVLQKAESDTASHLGLPLLLHSLEWLRLSLVRFGPTVPPKLFPGMVWMAVWAGSHLGAVGAEGSLGPDHAAFVMAMENLTLQSKPLWSLPE